MDHPPESKRAPTPGSWKPGQSGNPKGRPRAGLALAERIRERFDPDIIVDLANRLAADETLSVSSRLAALLPFAQLGYVKPPSQLELGPPGTFSDEEDARADKYTLEELRELDAIEARRAARLALESRVSDPKVVDGGQALLPVAVALAAASTDEE